MISHPSTTERSEHDDDEHVSGFEVAGVWAFLEAAGTIALIGLAVFLGELWRALT